MARIETQTRHAENGTLDSPSRKEKTDKKETKKNARLSGGFNCGDWTAGHGRGVFRNLVFASGTTGAIHTSSIKIIFFFVWGLTKKKDRLFSPL